MLKKLPLALRLAITTALTVPLMTWVAMPRVTRLLSSGSSRVLEATNSESVFIPTAKSASSRAASWSPRE
jgi:hypothetical protein